LGNSNVAGAIDQTGIIVTQGNSITAVEPIKRGEKKKKKGKKKRARDSRLVPQGGVRMGPGFTKSNEM